MPTSTRLHAKPFLTLLAATFIAACGSSPNGSDAGMGGNSGAGGGDAAGGGTSATGGGSNSGKGGGTNSGAGGGSSTDLGTSCSNPIMVTLGVDTAPVYLNAPGKKIHWRVAVTAGQFLIMDTAANPNNVPGAPDMTLSLYDEQGTQLLATGDDAYPRLSSDTTLFYRATQNGNLCVVGMDFPTWSGKTSESKAYPDPIVILISALSKTAMINNQDTEPNNSAAAPQTAKFVSDQNTSYAQLYGTLEGATDADVYQFALPATAKMLTVNLAPQGFPLALGSSSYGSTLPYVEVKVTNTSGVVLGKLSMPADMKRMPAAINVPVTPSSTVLVWIEGPASATTPGNNDFYSLLLSMGIDNTPEASEATNGTAGNAEALTLFNSPATNKVKFGFILGKLATASNDVDFYKFPATQGDTVELACAAQRAGSGLRGTVFSILNGTTALQTETESAGSDLYWSDYGTSKPALKIASTGTYLLKVNGATLDANNPSNYYRCGVTLISP